jgi:hypothetical protein
MVEHSNLIFNLLITMKTLSLYFSRQLFKWAVIVAAAYAAIHGGVPPSLICLLLLAGLALRVAAHFLYFIGSMLAIAVKAAIIILFLSLFL